MLVATDLIAFESVPAGISLDAWMWIRFSLLGIAVLMGIWLALRRRTIKPLRRGGQIINSQGDA